jgi:hypothetical protein
MPLTVSPASAPYAPPAVAEMESATHGQHLQREANRRHHPHPHADTPASAEPEDACAALESPPTHGTLIDVLA